MANSTNLILPYLVGGQAQKHVTVNESLRRLDALVQLNALSATTSAEPGAPDDGAVYVLPAGKTGANWGAMANGALAYYRDGAWEQISPRSGWLVMVRDSVTLMRHDGADWVAMASFGGGAARLFNGADSLTLDSDGLSVFGAGPVIDTAGRVRLISYTVAGLPSASPAGQMVYVSDGASNKRLAVSDGADWRFADGVVVS